jgi:hypothetical protein
MNIKYINQLTTLRDQINQVTTEANTDVITIDAKTVLLLINNCLQCELQISMVNDNLGGKPVVLH